MRKTIDDPFCGVKDPFSVEIPQLGREKKKYCKGIVRYEMLKLSLDLSWSTGSPRYKSLRYLSLEFDVDNFNIRHQSNIQAALAIRGLFICDFAFSRSKMELF